MTIPRLFVFPVLCLMITSGCSKQLKPDGLPDLVPVTITVIQDEKPLADAMVGFLPVEAENARWSAGAKTDSSGIAKPYVHGKYKGIAPGRYKIVVSKFETETPPGDPAPDKPSPPSKVYDLVDPKFGDADKVEEVEITMKGRNDISIDVGSAVRILVPPRNRR